VRSGIVSDYELLPRHSHLDADVERGSMPTMPVRHLDHHAAARNAVEAFVEDIPGFPWEKSLSGRHLIPGWEKIEFTAEEEDPGAVVGERAKASRVGFNLLDFAVETFSDGVGDGVEEIV